MGKETSHSAVGPALGYYYQALYSLVLLLRDPSDEAVVYLETKDDLELLNPAGQTLNQLKYSGSQSPLTHRDGGWWKTLGIWMSLQASAFLEDRRFCYVTTRPLAESSPLSCLMSDDASRSALGDAMRQEAARVVADPTVDQKSKKLAACKAYLQLGPASKELLLSRIRICPNSFKPADVDVEVAKYLLLVPPAKRPLIASRLVEWWDTQAFRSLTSASGPRPLSKIDVQSQVSELIKSSADDSLFDDFSARAPVDPLAELSGRMEAQIRLVEGTPAHYTRAAREKWRASNQRERWLSDDLRIGGVLEAYDAVMVEEWADRHEQMCHELKSAAESSKCEAGRKLLDWSHFVAPNEVRPIMPSWTQPFFVRGSYQILAENLRVGWHPDYLQHLKEAKDDSSNEA